MKVQFDVSGVRLRVSRDELLSLREGSCLHTTIAWPGGGWAVEVGAAERASVDTDGHTLRIRFRPADLDALDARLPSRDGLQAVLSRPGAPVAVRFEVDLHDGRARRR